MDNHTVNLRKPGDTSSTAQGYIDPATGEIYPQPAPAPAQQGGVFQPYTQQNTPIQQAQPEAVQVQQPAQVPAQAQPVPNAYSEGMKFCKYCGAKIPFDAVVCTACGRQVEELRQAQLVMPQVVINNTNTNTNTNIAAGGRPKDKWVAFLLCFFLGEFGIHRFYEGKILTGLLYMFTVGLFGIGWLIDLIIILCKPNPYYV